MTGSRTSLGALKPAADVVARRVGSETVLVNLETNRIYSLNATAARLWELLVDGATEEEIERTMVAEFDVEPTTVHREAAELVASLRAEHLLAPHASE